MKNVVLLFSFLAVNSLVKSQEIPITQVYIGTTACDGFIRHLISIPTGAECNKIKWKLTLYSSGKYHVTAGFGLQASGTPGFTGGGKDIEMDGTWKTEKGTASDRNAAVYMLDPGKNRDKISLVKMDDDILHFLYSDKNLLIGNAGYAYALHRVKQ